MMEKKVISTIDEYIAAFPPELTPKLNQIRAVIKQFAPEATEKMSWQMPTFYLNGNLVHFAAFKNHIGFYPAPSAIEQFKEELRPFKTSKGAVQFPHSSPLPVELISKMVAFRVQENLNK